MTTPQITLKPLPCPCCRSASTYESGLTSKRLKTEWYCKVECEKCGVSIELFDASETREPATEAAIATWNTRQPERPDMRALEELIQSEKELLATINPEDHPRLYAMTFTRIRAFHETQAALARPEAKGGGERPQADLATTGLKALVKFMDDLPQAARESVSYTEFRAVVDLLRTDTAKHQEMQRDGERLDWLLSPNNELMRIVSEIDGDWVVSREEIDLSREADAARDVKGSE